MRQGFKRAQHAGGATHVVLHFVHFGRGLERDAAGVKGDALANQDHWRLGFGRALVTQHNKAQRLLRALGHRHKRAHAQLGHLFGA